MAKPKKNADNTEADHTERIQRAVASDVPKIYFNGFSNSVGGADVVMSLELNGEPVAVLNASYTVAKTLAIKLMGLIKALEERTGNTIMTTEEITEAIAKSIPPDRKKRK